MIRAKLVFIFFVFILVPMFLLWARWQGTAVGSIRAVLQKDLGQRANEISDHLSLSLRAHQQQLGALAELPNLKSYARLAAPGGQAAPEQTLLHELTSFLLANQRDYSALLVINRQGAPIFKIVAQPTAQGSAKVFYAVSGFSNEDIVRAPEIASDKLPDVGFASDVEQDSSGPHVKLIAPLRDSGGAVVTALVLKLRAAQWFEQAIGPRPMASNSRFASPHADPIIVAPEGTVLYASKPANQGKPFAEIFQPFTQAFNQLKQGKEKDIDWQPWFVHYALREAKPRLSILLVENYASAIEDMEFSSYSLLLLTMLLVVVAMLALYYLISNITDSIRRVTTGAKAIATGNLGYQIKVKGRDETRVLAEAFNRMAARLREMIRKEGEQKQFESFARLSSVLTHDLKNQILSLSLLVSNMERKFDREGFKEDAMRTLSDSVNNLQNLVAKLSDPRTPMKRVREQSNLTYLVERVLQRTAGQATNKYQVSTEFAPEVSAVVDGKAVERVIENLVINALEAMPDGGALRIATKTDNGHAVISIADTGKGMTEEFLRDRLFHPFATTKKKGIGLGLYSCRDIIEQHGGRIDVASKVDAGTEFRVVLPVIAEESRSGELKPVVTV